MGSRVDWPQVGQSVSDPIKRGKIMWRKIYNHIEPTDLRAAIDMAARQLPLQTRYKTDPAAAWITDRATTSSKRINAAQSLYGEVTLEAGRTALRRRRELLRQHDPNHRQPHAY